MESINSTKSSLKAKVSVIPKLSQNFLVALLIVSTLAMLIGCSFLWFNKDYAAIPFLFSLLAIILAYIGWWRAREMTDMANALPTTLHDNNGNHLTTDTRTLLSPYGAEQIGILLQCMGVRQSLPEADGIVDRNGHIQDNSKDKATRITEEINHDIQQKSSGFMQEVIKGKKAAIQEKPNEQIIDSKEILEHNKSSAFDKI